MQTHDPMKSLEKLAAAQRVLKMIQGEGGADVLSKLYRNAKMPTGGKLEHVMRRPGEVEKLEFPSLDKLFKQLKGAESGGIMTPPPPVNPNLPVFAKILANDQQGRRIADTAPAMRTLKKLLSMHQPRSVANLPA